MQNREDETRGSEWRQVAERLAGALGSLRPEPAGSELARGKDAGDRPVRPAPTPGTKAIEIPEVMQPLGTAVQGLETVTKGLSGTLGWLGNLNPVLGLLRLFRGGGERQEEVALPRYEAPARESYLGGISAGEGWAVRRADYGEGWQARGMEGGRSPAPAPQVTVQVQAMDSRSFLDHRDEIAAAVRQALLESHSLGDVMGEE